MAPTLTSGEGEVLGDNANIVLGESEIEENMVVDIENCNNNSGNNREREKVNRKEGKGIRLSNEVQKLLECKKIEGREQSPFKFKWANVNKVTAKQSVEARESEAAFRQLKQDRKLEKDTETLQYFLELFSGVGYTTACVTLLDKKTMLPIDNKHYNLDANSKAVRDYCERYLEAGKIGCLHLSWECGKGGAWAMVNWKGDSLKEAQAKKDIEEQAGYWILFAGRVLDRGGHVGVEHPEVTVVWGMKFWTKFQEKYKLRCIEFNHCVYGSDHLKASRFYTSMDPKVTAYFQSTSRCGGGHEHVRIAGLDEFGRSLSDNSKVYKPKLAQAFGKMYSDQMDLNHEKVNKEYYEVDMEVLINTMAAGSEIKEMRMCQLDSGADMMVVNSKHAEIIERSGEYYHVRGYANNKSVRLEQGTVIMTVHDMYGTPIILTAEHVLLAEEGNFRTIMCPYQLLDNGWEVTTDSEYLYNKQLEVRLPLFQQGNVLGLVSGKPTASERTSAEYINLVRGHYNKKEVLKRLTKSKFLYGTAGEKVQNQDGMVEINSMFISMEDSEEAEGG